MYSYYEEKNFARIEKEEGTFFMFFTSGLLYWVLKSLSLLKNTSRIFLIAAGLDENEKKVLNKHTDIQIFYIKNHCTDKDILHMLLNTCQKNFGYIDIDCFIFDETVLDNISNIQSNVIINSYWTKTFQWNHKFLNTFLMYFNVDNIKEVKKRVPEITPYTYSYKELYHEGTKIIPPCYYNRIQQFVPLFEYPYWEIQNRWPPYFDTLLLFQLIANSMDLSINDQFTNSINHRLPAFHVGGSMNFSFYRLKMGQSNDVIQDMKRYYDKNKITPRYDKNNKDEWKILLVSFLLNEYIDYLPIEYKYLQKLLNKKLVKATNKRNLFHEIQTDSDWNILFNILNYRSTALCKDAQFYPT